MTQDATDYMLKLAALYFKHGDRALFDAGNNDAKASVNFAAWSQEPVWKDAASCEGNLHWSWSGSMSNPRISEAGRALLAGQLNQLTDAQLKDLFEVARFTDRDPSATVAQWVERRGEPRAPGAARANARAPLISAVVAVPAEAQVETPVGAEFPAVVDEGGRGAEAAAPGELEDRPPLDERRAAGQEHRKDPAILDSRSGSGDHEAAPRLKRVALPELIRDLHPGHQVVGADALTRQQSGRLGDVFAVFLFGPPELARLDAANGAQRR